MADNSEMFVIERSGNGQAWLLMYEYSESEEFFEFADLDLAKAHAGALAGVPLQWREIDGGVTAVVE